ncbi:hypothetical protein GCM10022203_21380 [Micrococcus yunnanensis]
MPPFKPSHSPQPSLVQCNQRYRERNTRNQRSHGAKERTKRTSSRPSELGPPHADQHLQRAYPALHFIPDGKLHNRLLQS